MHVLCVLMHVHARIHVHVCVALPIVVGAWPMAGTLWQLFEYYYYYIYILCACDTHSCTLCGLTLK